MLSKLPNLFDQGFTVVKRSSPERGCVDSQEKSASKPSKDSKRGAQVVLSPPAKSADSRERRKGYDSLLERGLVPCTDTYLLKKALSDRTLDWILDDLNCYLYSDTDKRRFMLVGANYLSKDIRIVIVLVAPSTRHYKGVFVKNNEHVSLSRTLQKIQSYLRMNNLDLSDVVVMDAHPDNHSDNNWKPTTSQLNTSGARLTSNIKELRPHIVHSFGGSAEDALNRVDFEQLDLRPCVIHSPHPSRVETSDKLITKLAVGLQKIGHKVLRRNLPDYETLIRNPLYPAPKLWWPKVNGNFPLLTKQEIWFCLTIYCLQNNVLLLTGTFKAFSANWMPTISSTAKTANRRHYHGQMKYERSYRWSIIIKASNH